jgi:hypothetical protein
MTQTQLRIINHHFWTAEVTIIRKVGAGPEQVVMSIQTLKKLLGVPLVFAEEFFVKTLQKEHPKYVKYLTEYLG